MPKQKETEVGPLSQAAVASFVLGVLQTTITGAYFVFLMFLVKTFQDVPGFSIQQPTSGTLNPESFPLLVLANIWGIVGLATGFIAVRSTREGKSGDALGLIGILLSVLCLGATFVPVVAQAFGFSLTWF